MDESHCHYKILHVSDQNRSMADLASKLADLLVSYHACFSLEEAEVIAEIVLNSGNLENDGSASREGRNIPPSDHLVEGLVENLGVEEDEATNIILEWKRKTDVGNDNEKQEDDSDTSDDEESTSSSLDLEDYEVTDEYLIDGECELCDRYIKLTKHHLIPKQTWPRIQAKLLHASEAIGTGDEEKALAILGPGLEYLLSEGCLSSGKSSVRRILHSTCDVCRQCHSTVHRTHTNMDLALCYSTVEKLLEDDQIYKFCKWASKQRAGKYSRR